MDRELILDLEARAVRAIPAKETVRIGTWLVALGRGAMLRTNSCTTFGDSPRRELFEHIERVERRYTARGRPTRFRLTPLDRHLDARLETRGYTGSDAVVVMTGPVGGGPDGEIAVAGAAGPDWTDRLSRWGGHDETRTSEIAESLGALTLDHGLFTGPSGIGVAVVDPPWVGLFHVMVDPAARRQGNGRRLAGTMLSWAADRGAERAYLQVLETNTAAQSMYGALGFSPAYTYHYRTDS